MSAANSNGEAEKTTGLLNSDASLKPFLDILDESSSSMKNLSTVRSLALKIFAHPQIFCGFDEFKSRCRLLLGAEDASNSSLFNTLDLFSFGSLKDYNNHTDNKDYYMPLNEPALAKLGQLTVLTCIQQACFHGETSISYDSLADSLGSSSSSAAMQEDGVSSSTANIRETEDVLIRCMYSNVLNGKLCQKTRSFCWKGESLPVVLSRDVAPQSLSGLLSALEGLGQRLEESQQSVSSAQDQVTQGLETTAKHWASLQAEKKIDLDNNNNNNNNEGKMGGNSQSPSRIFGRGFSGQTSGSMNRQRSSKRSRALGPAFAVPKHRGSEF